MTRLVFVDTETTGLDPDVHEIWEVACIVRELPDAEGKADGKDEGEYVWQLPVDLSRADPFALNVGRFHERRWDPCSAQSLEAGVARRGRWDEVVKLTQPEPGFETASKFKPRIVPDLRQWATLFAELTWGAHLVGAVVSFDEERLRRLLRAHGACPGWHYHLIDVESLAAGYVLGRAKGIAMCAPSTPQANRIREDTGISLPHIGQFSGALGLVKTARELPWKSEDLSRAVGVDPDKLDRHSALGDARWAEQIYDKVTLNAKAAVEALVSGGE